jgi:hypothetical protein
VFGSGRDIDESVISSAIRRGPDGQRAHGLHRDVAQTFVLSVIRPLMFTTGTARKSHRGHGLGQDRVRRLRNERVTGKERPHQVVAGRKVGYKELARAIGGAGPDERRVADDEADARKADVVRGDRAGEAVISGRGEVECW